MAEDPPDPPRKFYGLKPREFETVNGPPRTAPAGAQSPLPDAGIPPAAAAPITVGDLTRAAAGSAPALGTHGPVNRANDVHALLALNRERAEAGGSNEVILKTPRASRRKRDYWFLVIATNLGLLGFLALTGGFNAVTILLGLGLGVMITAALTWLMWFVMDPY